jgi:hypothetical protein
MIRTVVTPKNQELSIQIPPNYVGKRVEVIAFTIDEAIDESEKTDKTVTHFAAENLLSKDWLTPEEDTAWQTL